MIKTRTGNYLKELRKKNEWSLERLSSEIMEHGGDYVSINSISDWEKGVNYPNIDNLEILSEIYNKSIDEILDGEDYKDIDYTKEYILADDAWGMKFDNKANLWQIRNEQTLKVVKRFKEFLLIRINREFTHNEENEFKFLFNNFYDLSEYADDEYVSTDSNDEYLRLKSAINECLIVIRNMTEKEKYWEIEKLFDEKDKIQFKYLNDINDINEERIHILLDRFDNLEDWYKDMMLATFQNIDPISVEPSDYGSRYMKIFEDNNGELFDREKFIKSKLKIMIKHGAKINSFFLNIKKKQKRKYRIIDRLEELYDLCEKPIKVSCYDDDEGSGENTAKYYLLESNSKNRFLNDYYFQLSRDFGEDYYTNGEYSDVEELYEFFMKYEKIPDDIRLDIAKKYCEKHNYKIDYSQEERFWKADLNWHTKSIFETYDKCRQKEVEIEKAKEELKYLENLLYSGKKEYELEEYKEIGGHDQFSIRQNIIYWKSKMPYDEFLDYRDDKLTKALLKEIDNLSIQEIRDKYFKVEVYEK